MNECTFYWILPESSGKSFEKPISSKDKKSHATEKARIIEKKKVKNIDNNVKARFDKGYEIINYSRLITFYSKGFLSFNE